MNHCLGLQVAEDKLVAILPPGSRAPGGLQAGWALRAVELQVLDSGRGCGEAEMFLAPALGLRYRGRGSSPVLHLGGHWGSCSFLQPRAGGFQVLVSPQAVSAGACG